MEPDMHPRLCNLPLTASRSPEDIASMTTALKLWTAALRDLQQLPTDLHAAGSGRASAQGPWDGLQLDKNIHDFSHLPAIDTTVWNKLVNELKVRADHCHNQI